MIMNKLNILTFYNDFKTFFKMLINAYNSSIFVFIFDFTNNVINIFKIVTHFKYANFYF